MALRLALGASRGAIVTSLLVEGVVYGVCAAGVDSSWHARRCTVLMTLAPAKHSRSARRNARRVGPGVRRGRGRLFSPRGRPSPRAADFESVALRDPEAGRASISPSGTRLARRPRDNRGWRRYRAADHRGVAAGELRAV